MYYDDGPRFVLEKLITQLVPSGLGIHTLSIEDTVYTSLLQPQVTTVIHADESCHCEVNTIETVLSDTTTSCQ